MTNVFDYLRWRGDLSFAQVPFCDVDALVLSRFAYFPLDGIVPENGPSQEDVQALQKGHEEAKAETLPVAGYTIAEAWNSFLLKHPDSETKEDEPFLNKQDRPLFQTMADSRRFGHLQVFGFVNHFDPKAQKQFSAVTVMLTADTAFVAYRGTDNTLVDWQEDFNMGFMHPVPAQEEAVTYLQRIAGETSARLRTGGHSKGGNLAVYAPAFAGEEVQRRILSIHNLDGPGFLEETLQAPSFVAIAGMIHTFLPQSSIVGMLLDHEEAYTVVHSTNMGAMQHDVFSWEVLGPAFVQLEQVTASSTFVNRSLKEWITGMTPEERQAFSQALAQVLGALGVTRLSELRQNLPQRAMDIVNSLRDVDPATRQVLLKTASALVQSALSTAWDRWNKQEGKEDEQENAEGQPQSS